MSPENAGLAEPALHAQTDRSTEPSHRGGKAAWLCWTIVSVCGLLQAWSHRFFVEFDGTSYLDIAENYARGNWHAAVNGYWSPLYSWILALCSATVHYSLRWESTVLHLINFAAYLLAYAAFRFLLRELAAYRNRKFGSETAALTAPLWELLGLGLFLYSALFMANSAGSTPDILVVGLVYCAAGLALRAVTCGGSISVCVLLGAVLGLSYFAKTAMFPVSLVVLGVALAGTWRMRCRRFAMLFAPLCFAVVVAPWIVTLSRAKGRATFGDSGKLAYAQLVRPLAPPLAWQGRVDPAQPLRHPPRILMVHPGVIEFAAPVAGTFPLWYEASYWLDGTTIRFSPAGQFRVLLASFATGFRLLLDTKEFLVLILILILADGSPASYLHRMLQLWELWIPAAFAIGMYALVLVEPRYIAPFVVILWLGVFAASRMPSSAGAQTFVRNCVLAALIVTAIGVTRASISDARLILHPPANQPAEVAAALRKNKIADGASIALVGTPRDTIYWARLAGLRIVALIPAQDAPDYWKSSPAVRSRVTACLKQAGAAALVTDALPSEHTDTGWIELGQTPYRLRLLEDPRDSCGAF